jgi:HK97 family phage portal protein
VRLVDRLRLAVAALTYKQTYVTGTADTQDLGQKLITAVGSAPTITGVSVTPDTAMRQTTWFTCVRILAETVGSLPASFYERRPDGTAIKVDYDLGDVLFSTPNAEMDKVQFIEAGMTNLAGQGNQYCYKNMNGGMVSSLYPIPAPFVKPQRNRDTGAVEYVVADRGKTETLPAEKIWHVKGFGDGGLEGLSPIGYQRQLIGMALATEEWQARFFANGATPSALFKMPAFMKPDQRKQMQENLQRLMGGLQHAHEAFVLEGGVEPVPMTMPLKDAQFLELRDASRSDIFGMFRIPPHMGGDLSNATFSNIEHQALEFVMHAVMPYLTRYEASINRWLMPLKDRRKYFVRWNVDGLLRADATARAALYAVMVANGIMSRNEVRALENLNRSDEAGMDGFTVQTAMAPIALLEAIARQNSRPTGKPVAAELTPAKALADVVNNFTVGLPDSVKHSFAHELPGVLEMVDAVRESNVLSSKGSIEVREAISALADRLRETNAVSREGIKSLGEQLLEIQKTQLLPRKAIVDGVEVISQIEQPNLRRVK